jgi:hypothetical protein
MGVASAAARAGGDLRKAVGVLLGTTTRGLARASGRRSFWFLAVDGDSDSGATVGYCDAGWKGKVSEVVFGCLRRKGMKKSSERDLMFR